MFTTKLSVIIHQEYNAYLMADITISILPCNKEDSTVHLEARIKAINGDFMGAITIECKRTDIVYAVKSKQFMAHVENAYIAGEFAVMQKEIREGNIYVH